VADQHPQRTDLHTAHAPAVPYWTNTQHHSSRQLAGVQTRSRSSWDERVVRLYYQGEWAN